MKNAVIARMVKTRFGLTSREKASRQAREALGGYLRLVEELPELKGTAKKMHPVFGPFDAHQWHCMFAFHPDIHLKQAKAVARLAG